MRKPRLFAAGALGAWLAACGAPAAPLSPTSSGVCEGGDLARCERALAGALAAGRRADRATVESYLTMRTARSADDAWAALYRELAAGRGGAVVVADAGVAASPAESTAGVRRVQIGALPKADGIEPDALLAVLGGAAEVELVVRRTAAGTTAIVPSDPLAPFMPGLLPIYAAASHRVGADLALARLVRKAFEAASAFDYVAAAAAADEIETALAARGVDDPAALRARFALALLDTAGVELEPEIRARAGLRPDAAIASKPKASAPAEFAPTPYSAYIALRSSRDTRAAWPALGPAILPGVPEVRRAALAALYDGTSTCAARPALPAIEAPADLVLVRELARALGAARGTLPPVTDWLPRYERAVGLAEQTRTGWYYVGQLLEERGDVLGMGPPSSGAHARVTDLGLKHLDAERKLQKAAPARYRVFADLGLALRPGTLSDEALRTSLLSLSQAAAHDRLALAHDASGVWAGVLTGAIAGYSYPGVVQSAHFKTVQAEFGAKLDGELSKQTGWGVAGLYALGAAFGAFVGSPRDLGATATQIDRALSAADVEAPALAGLARAANRYAKLGFEKNLSAHDIDPARLPPERVAARNDLRVALAGLGAPGEAPANVLDDVTTLADGLIAVLAAEAAGAPAAAATCPANDATGPSPVARRALAKLGDVRQRILSHPRYKNGDGAWVRRTRLVVTVLSDAMDVALREKDRSPKFAIGAEEASKNVAAGLREWEMRAGADAAAQAYGLFRAVWDEKEARGLVAHGGPRIRSALGSLASLLGEGGATTSAAAALFKVLAAAPLGLGGGEDARGMLVATSKAFAAVGKSDQADLCLLLALTIGALEGTPPPPDAIESAAARSSRVEWALRLAAEVKRAEKGEKPDTAAFSKALDHAVEVGCGGAQQEGALVVRALGAGSTADVATALEAALVKAESDGLAVPRFRYVYNERAGAKALTLQFNLALSGGVIPGANTFQMGLGIDTDPERTSGLDAYEASTDTPEAGQDAAAVYVYAAALAAAYRLSAHEHGPGATDAARAVQAMTHGLKLGTRTVRAPGAKAVEGARGLLAIDAQLAAESGMPFLAGDLWTLVKAALDPHPDDAAVAKLLDPLPLGASVLPADVVARAKKSLRIVAASADCSKVKAETGGFVEVACDGYASALALRAADALKKLPHLKPGSKCAAERAIDGFLVPMERGRYDPDAFTAALEALRSRPFEAAVLLARQRHASHCSPVILAAAHTLAHSPEPGRALHADLLTTAINCSMGGADPQVDRDLLELDLATQKLADPGRNLSFVLQAADWATRADRYDAFAAIVARPGYFARWASWGPRTASAALVFGAAAPLLANKPQDEEALRGAYRLLCETFPPGDHASECASAKALLDPGSGDRRAAAKTAIQAVVVATVQAKP